jgi:hypothetical protein
LTNNLRQRDVGVTKGSEEAVAIKIEKCTCYVMLRHMNRSSKSAERVRIREFDSPQEVNHGKRTPFSHAIASR